MVSSGRSEVAEEVATERAQDQEEEEEERRGERRDMTPSQVLTFGCLHARVLCHRLRPD